MAEQPSIGRPIPAGTLANSVRPEYDEYNVPPNQSQNDKPNYDAIKAEQANEQEYQWSDTLFKIKLRLVVVVTFLAMIILTGVLILTTWLICVFVIHYTVPGKGWLSSAELERLGAIYGNFAKFAAPTALITNAWLVAYFGTRRWTSQKGDQANRPQ